MKRIFLLTVSLFIGFNAFAQNVIENHFQYLVKDKNSTNISVSGKMFQMINSINIESDGNEDLEEMQEFIGSITGFQMVVGKEITSAKSQYNRGLEIVNGDYDELMSVDDKEGHFKLYVDEHKDVVREVVGIGTSEDMLMVFSFSGDMRLDQVGKVVQHMQSNDFTQNIDLKDMDPSKVSVYPNPANVNSQLQIEIPTTLQEGTAKLYDGQGNLVNSYELDGLSQSLDISGTTAGSYVLKVEKDGIQVTKKVVIIE